MLEAATLDQLQLMFVLFGLLIILVWGRYDVVALGALFTAAFLSMFMNNVGAVALLMPIAIQSTNKAGRSAASVLMPLS